MSTFRWVHIGVTAALAAAAVTAFGIIQGVGAATSPASTYVPMVPCRLADTRSGGDHVGVRPAAVTSGEVVEFTVWGTNGNCTIPTFATGISTNVTIANPTSASYLTVYPADAPTRPTASNLNWTATSSPTPNQVPVALSGTGVISVFNNAGTVDVIIDIVGYYVAAGVGGVGPAGPQGETGAQGPPGSQGAIGPQGPSGLAAAGAARAYAAIDSMFIVHTAKNITGATWAMGTGWCVTLDPSVPKATAFAVTSIDWSFSSALSGGGKTSFAYFNTGGGCAGNAISVITGYTLGTSTVLQAEGFEIIVP